MGTRYFPLFVDISKMKILVIGGGKIAARRIRTLLPFAEDITVVAPEILPELKEFVQAGKIGFQNNTYSPDILKEADMVLAATDDYNVNHAIAEDCKKLEQKENRHILVNIADDKSVCDFYFPSVILKEETVVAINSSGVNPGKVKQMRQKIEASLK